MACHAKLAEPLQASTMPKYGELLPVREQRRSLLETVSIVELGKPQQQINIVISLTPLVCRRQHHGVQGTQVLVARDTRQDISRLRLDCGPGTGQLVHPLQHCRWVAFFGSRQQSE